MNWRHIYTGNSLEEMARELKRDEDIELAAKNKELERMKAKELEMAKLIADQKAIETEKAILAAEDKKREEKKETSNTKEDSKKDIVPLNNNKEIKPSKEENLSFGKRVLRKLSRSLENLAK